jgi:hypothetical protein
MARKKKFDAFDVYINARSFWTAVGAIVKDANDKPNSQLHLFPMLINEAFCLELHLKCLKRYRRRRIARKHEVDDLFKSLSAVDKRKIEAHLKDVLHEHQNAILNGFDHDIGSILARSRSTFLSMRYWHERMEPSKDASGRSSNTGTAQLIEAVNRRLLDLNPMWREKIKRVKFRFLDGPSNW